ncbi:MAG: hypothetical protein J2P17_19260, partial [Mycobacterium sp.]|nr:hypothetical protein [Mycobacterium sp.]
MLTHSLQRLLHSIFLKFSGGDSIRADALRARFIGVLMSIILVTYIPLLLVVVYLFFHRQTPANTAAQQDQETAVKAYAVRYLNAYLSNPSNSDAIKQFYDGNIPQADAGSSLTPGGHATSVSSALPGRFTGGIQTWSVVVDCQLPKAAHSAATVYMPLQVDISIDSHGLFRSFTLPHPRPERPSGEAVQLATETSVAEGLPVYNTVRGFLNAMLIGHTDIAPYVAAGSTLKAAQHSSFAALHIERMTANSDLAAGQDVPPKADGVEITVDASVVSGSGVPMPMQFPLAVSVAAGHWQVDRINDSPSITVPDHGSSITPTTTASSTPSTSPTPFTREPDSFQGG